MLGFLKRRKQERDKQWALQVGNEVVSGLNSIVEDWRVRLEVKRDMILDAFGERLVGLPASADLPYRHAVEIEWLAMTKNWAEALEEEVDAVRGSIGPLWDYIDTIGIRSETEQFIMKTRDEVDEVLIQRSSSAVDEAVVRHEQ